MAATVGRHGTEGRDAGRTLGLADTKFAESKAGAVAIYPDTWVGVAERGAELGRGVDFGIPPCESDRMVPDGQVPACRAKLLPDREVTLTRFPFRRLDGTYAISAPHCLSS